MAWKVSSLAGVFALVLERDRDALVEERELAQPVRQRGPAELEDGEDLGVRLEPDRRAGALGLAVDLELLAPSCRARSAM